MAFMRFLVDINSHAGKRQLSVVAVTQPEDSSNTRISQVVDHITRNFAEDISLESAADLAHERDRLLAEFPEDHRQQVPRIPEPGARWPGLLDALCHRPPVSVICYEVGFQNLANFNRNFMKMKGMTPTEYRALARVELAKKEATA